MSDGRCKFCGKELNRKQKMFCSYECMGKNNVGTHPSSTLVICANCQKEFYASNSMLAGGQFKYCSNDCRKTRIERVCENCKKTIYVIPSKGKRKFCNQECYFDYLSKKRMVSQKPKTITIKKHREVKTCFYCGAIVFEKGRKKYCSDICAKKGGYLTSHILSNCKVCGKEFYAYKPDVINGMGKYCSMRCFMNIRTIEMGEASHSVANGGKRVDLNNQYFRSSWEANYARYLNWLVELKEIKSWEFEPETFMFEKIKRGNISYTPDFRIINNDESIEYHEIKGYMDKDSKVKIKRFNKYFPELKLLIIDKPTYIQMSRQLRKLIPGWEWNDKHSY